MYPAIDPADVEALTQCIDFVVDAPPDRRPYGMGAMSTHWGRSSEQLTGPGGAFEVVTEVVDGVEMRVYKDRMGSLREVAQVAIDRGDQEFIVQGDRRLTFGDFVAPGQRGVPGACAADAGVGHGDRVAVLSANNPEWCLAFWATVDLGAILVGLNGWWKTDEILYGLDDSGAKVLVADAKRFERIADQLDERPASSAST